MSGESGALRTSLDVCEWAKIIADAELSLLTDEFADVVADAVSKARAAALEAGNFVVYRDEEDRYVAEYPGGRRFEVRFDSTLPRESHLVVLRELASNVANSNRQCIDDDQ